ncbi:hypothetical protein [Streptomyces melanosporofaciens]|uniref:Uncharacterized protein n=1 Tax=Streptomyces melanosporofaciens TaxID=67327 RepID=A0A1H4X9K0_STRMJ|nr:hypothetical protein [Streptomyces melanosporofaciens]SED01374.1 hypothetical protein SAMN04490356_6498 [Streptomyces melanosporofaciens]
MSAVSLWDDFDIPPQARTGRVTLNLYDQLSACAPKRPGTYPRISFDRFGLEAGVDRQHEDAEDTRRRLRWGPFAKIYKENDTSAFNAVACSPRQHFTSASRGRSHRQHPCRGERPEWWVRPPAADLPRRR